MKAHAKHRHQQQKYLDHSATLLMQRTPLHHYAENKAGATPRRPQHQLKFQSQEQSLLMTRALQRSGEWSSTKCARPILAGTPSAPDGHTAMPVF
jgi:hypothetical protein